MGIASSGFLLALLRSLPLLLSLFAPLRTCQDADNKQSMYSAGIFERLFNKVIIYRGVGSFW